MRSWLPWYGCVNGTSSEDAHLWSCTQDEMTPDFVKRKHIVGTSPVQRPRTLRVIREPNKSQPAAHMANFNGMEHEVKWSKCPCGLINGCYSSSSVSPSAHWHLPLASCHGQTANSEVEEGRDVLMIFTKNWWNASLAVPAGGKFTRPVCKSLSFVWSHPEGCMFSPLHSLVLWCLAASTAREVRIEMGHNSCGGLKWDDDTRTRWWGGIVSKAC